MSKTHRILPVLLVGVATFLLAMLVSSIVYAQGDSAPATDENLVQRITEMAFQIITPIIALFAMWAANRLIGVFEKKTGFDIPDKQEKAVEGLIEQGILFAEEKSRSAIKAKADKLSGPDKLEAAGGYVLDIVKANGWVGWTRDRINKKIEAKLGYHRANGGKPRLDSEDHPDLPVPK